MPEDTPAGQPKFPEGRYGRRREARPPRRWVAALLTGVVILAGFAVAAQLHRQYGDPEYRHQVITFAPSESRVKIKFQVFKPGGQAAVCIVRARAENGEEVGRAEVDIPAGSPTSDSVTVTYTLATSRQPVTGEIAGCAAAGS